MEAFRISSKGLIFDLLAYVGYMDNICLVEKHVMFQFQCVFSGGSGTIIQIIDKCCSLNGLAF